MHNLISQTLYDNLFKVNTLEQFREFILFLFSFYDDNFYFAKTLWNWYGPDNEWIEQYIALRPWGENHRWCYLAVYTNFKTGNRNLRWCTLPQPNTKSQVKSSTVYKIVNYFISMVDVKPIKKIFETDVSIIQKCKQRLCKDCLTENCGCSEKLVIERLLDTQQPAKSVAVSFYDDLKVWKFNTKNQMKKNLIPYIIKNSSFPSTWQEAEKRALISNLINTKSVFTNYQEFVRLNLEFKVREFLIHLGVFAKDLQFPEMIILFKNYYNIDDSYLFWKVL
jgi:hypothetical protein